MKRLDRIRTIPKPGPSSWLFLAVVLGDRFTPASTAWNQLEPRLPETAPLAVLATAVLFGLGFHHARLTGVATLFAALVWLVGAGGPLRDLHPSVPLLMLAVNWCWIGTWPSRARLSWRGIASLVLIVMQALAVAEGGALISQRFKALDASLGGAGTEPWAASLLLVALLPWIVRRLIGRAGLPFGALWAAASFTLSLLSTDDPARSSLFLWTTAILSLMALAEASYRLAFTDELTGLRGRRALVDGLAQLRGEFAVGVVDVDHFKSFNDRHGHEVGDQVLRWVAEELRKVRGAEAYRLGGEEFALVFSRGGLERALEELEAVRRGIAERRFTVRAAKRPRRKPTNGSSKKRAKSSTTGTVRRKVTVSIGVAAPRLSEARAEDVLVRADKALYRAKRAGRNRVAVAGRR